MSVYGEIIMGGDVYAQVTTRGRTFRVDATGAYDELVELPLDQFSMTEDSQDMWKVNRYARLYRTGSPFPPINVMGPTSRHAKHAITNGHHRYLAAQRVGAATIHAWTCFYVEYHLDCHRKPFATLARVSETKLGREIARTLGMTWCPHCGSSLNVPKPGQFCASCSLDREILGTSAASEFEGLDKTLSQGELYVVTSGIRPVENSVTLGQ